MAHGIVVDHKESGVRYAVSERNFNEKIHTKVRDLKPGESVIGFQPKRRKTVGEAAPVQLPAKTEGSPSGGTKDAK
ncbi:hypothetical protein SEA_PHERBOT_13 [Microbacterium phage Pherbot]|nr:hypothetical protein SEA_PHERBOT_13 [Microbacterium phage Pherbot]QCG77919.1 hypothetical protein SEA_BUSTLETON_13 [Microbacterium phage Bustleton]